MNIGLPIVDKVDLHGRRDWFGFWLSTDKITEETPPMCLESNIGRQMSNLFSQADQFTNALNVVQFLE